MEEIEEEVKPIWTPTYKIAYPRKEREKAIVASCMTGMGTALRLQQLLRDSIPEEAGIRILAHDYARLKMNGLQDPGTSGLSGASGSGGLWILIWKMFPLSLWNS